MGDVAYVHVDPVFLNMYMFSKSMIENHDTLNNFI